MTEKKGPKRRTQVRELPKQEKKLSKDEQKKVKGGEDIGSVEYDAKGLAIGRGVRVRGT
jgi:hypothetical protein